MTASSELGQYIIGLTPAASCLLRHGWCSITELWKQDHWVQCVICWHLFEKMHSYIKQQRQLEFRSSPNPQSWSRAVGNALCYSKLVPLYSMGILALSSVRGAEFHPFFYASEGRIVSLQLEITKFKPVIRSYSASSEGKGLNVLSWFHSLMEARRDPAACCRVEWRGPKWLFGFIFKSLHGKIPWVK